MPGIFNTLNTANKGLKAQQIALHITGHNIANANTSEYTRQRLNMKADLAYRYIGVGQLGTGVRMESVTRINNEYTRKQIRQENSEYYRFKAKSEAMDELEIIFNEPTTTGLSFYIEEMFDSWKELSMNPEFSTSKTLVVENSIAFTDVANHMLDQMDKLKIETHNQISKEVLDFNTNIDKLDRLNKHIYNIAIKNEVPNDLLDQRDLILNKLSKNLSFTVDFDKYGRVKIGLENEQNEEINILNFNGDRKILKYNQDKTQIFLEGNGKDNLYIKVVSGSVKGYIESLKDIDLRINELKTNLYLISQAINRTYNWDNYNDNKNDIFYIEEDRKIRVNEKYIKNHNLINAGKNIEESGDGERALSISKLRKIRFQLDENDMINNKFNIENLSYQQKNTGVTIEGMYRDIVTKIGISKQHSNNMIDNQKVLLDQLIFKRESESGVSIDEEVSNIIKYQKAYEANAKVISILTEMLDILINRTGV